MLKIGIIGLDTSHSIEFPRLMQAPDTPAEQRVPGLRAVSCLRFETPFQNQAGLDQRQKQLEAWEVKVTTDFDEAAAGCDAYMLEINDGSYHREYFQKVAALGKPVFLDKPLATTLEDGRAILRTAAQHRTRVWSGSSLPFDDELAGAVRQFAEVKVGHAYGALGKALAGDSLIWYGVHTFEMLQRIMGPGARQVRAVETEAGAVAIVAYDQGRQGLVECLPGCWIYGGRVQGLAANQEQKVVPFLCRPHYGNILRALKAFFEGGPAPVPLSTTFEGLAMMIAARRAIESGQAEPVAVP